MAVDRSHDANREAPAAWGDDVPLRGEGAPKNDGHIKYLIEYLLTVYKRFGNTSVTTSLQWGASALWKRDEQAQRIAELEEKLATQSETQQVDTAKATYDTERAALVKEFGECCKGSDPLCSGGCLIEKAIRKRAAHGGSAKVQESAAQPQVPEGMVLVPRSMLQQWINDGYTATASRWTKFRTDIRAMLAVVAPKGNEEKQR